MKPKEIVRLTKEAGFSRATLYRARMALEGTVVDSGAKFLPDKEWQLADE